MSGVCGAVITTEVALPFASFPDGLDGGLPGRDTGPYRPREEE